MVTSIIEYFDYYGNFVVVAFLFFLCDLCVFPTEIRNIPDQPDAYYRHCTSSPQRVVQSQLTTQYITTNKNFSPQFQYSPSQNEVEGENF